MWAAVCRRGWKSFVGTPAAKDWRGCKRRWRQGMTCRRLQQLLVCLHVDKVVQRWHWLSYAMPSWIPLPRRRVCWGKVFCLVRTSFQLLTVFLRSITEVVSVDLVGAVVWIGVFRGCSDSYLHCGSLIRWVVNVSSGRSTVRCALWVVGCALCVVRCALCVVRCTLCVVGCGCCCCCSPCRVFARFRSGRKSSNRWCFRVSLQLSEQLDDGWSVEEQGLLLIVWKHDFTNNIWKMCYRQSRRGIAKQNSEKCKPIVCIANTFTHRHFYTQKLLHTEAFTHRSFYTEAITYKAFTHRSFYIQTF